MSISTIILMNILFNSTGEPLGIAESYFID